VTEPQWTKARIKPLDVEVRRVTNLSGEPISRNGHLYTVKYGHYIVRQPDGTLWQCSRETFETAYEVIKPRQRR